MANIGFKKPNIGRVVAKLVGTVIALWVGGTIITSVGTVMNGTCSPFYQGLSLIGWTVSSSGGTGDCASSTSVITATTGTGVLSVIGIIGIASVILEFVTIRY